MKTRQYTPRTYLKRAAPIILLAPATIAVPFALLFKQSGDIAKWLLAIGYATLIGPSLLIAITLYLLQLPKTNAAASSLALSA